MDTRHRDVAVITFTGSRRGRLEAQGALPPANRHVLELGSNTAMVVAADADLPRAVDDAVAVGGYTDSADKPAFPLQRVYVEEPIAAEFTRHARSRRRKAARG